jgi:hypothetical protein
MAVYKLFPEKDTTIYSEYPNTNTGLDQILEISNKIGSLTDGPFSARSLIKFNTNDIIDTIDLANTTISASLKLYLADADNLPDSYILKLYPIYEEWNVGTGRFLYNPPYNDNCTWKNNKTSDSWVTSSFPSGVTGSFLVSSSGGGNWLFNNECTQSFEINQTKDINIDVTNIIRSINTGSITNNGFIIKFENTYDFNTTSSYSLRYFSKDTHTIYPPQLEIKWNDSVYNTGSLTVLGTENNVITLGNNSGNYNTENIVIFRVNARPIYPIRQFVTSSVYILNSALPISTYWALQDLNTGEFVIDFDENYTKVSCDSQGNYFTLYMAGLQPGRYYKVLIKSIFNDGSTVVYDNNNIFKLSK